MACRHRYEFEDEYKVTAYLRFVFNNEMITNKIIFVVVFFSSDYFEDFKALEHLPPWLLYPLWASFTNFHEILRAFVYFHFAQAFLMLICFCFTWLVISNNHRRPYDILLSKHNKYDLILFLIFGASSLFFYIVYSVFRALIEDDICVFLSRKFIKNYHRS
jgi:hypothetical protein